MSSDATSLIIMIITSINLFQLSIIAATDAGKLMLKESSTPQVVSASAASPAPTISTAGSQSPSKGVKLFTLNNKLLLPKAHKNLGNVQV